jgi:CRP/FNR family transcriptional regulator, dissimilatory nitrate respiration regulator
MRVRVSLSPPPDVFIKLIDARNSRKTRFDILLTCIPVVACGCRVVRRHGKRISILNSADTEKILSRLAGSEMPFDANKLAALPLFSDLSREDATTVAEKCMSLQVHRGSYLYLHGDKVKAFYVVCRGVMQLFRETPDGHEITTEILLAGYPVNIDEIVCGGDTHRLNARAVEDAMLLQVPLSLIREMASRMDHVGLKLMAALSGQLQHRQMDIEHRSTMSATQIVACYLQELCILYGFNPRGFDLPYSKTLIASRLRMELETFSRTLKNLKSKGIEVTGTHVSITAFDKIDNFVCARCSNSEGCATRTALLKLVQSAEIPALPEAPKGRPIP